MNIPISCLRKIAVVCMWPDLKTAEDEVISRIVNTCKKHAIEVVIIDIHGKALDYPHEKIDSTSVDFVIHLHFETPKTYDAFSFVALWNPLDFYKEWGYRRYSGMLTSHDDFLSCKSASADDHINRLISNDSTHLPPHFTLFHSLSEPVYTPDLGEKKLFYVGINWERLGKGPGRHDDLLKALDSTGELAIYGPKSFQGVDVWEGFSSYVGPLPFDGVSVIDAIHKAGVSLVLSSKAHKKAGLMSSRLFESIAAGAVIIVDENEFARKHFGDTLLYIETENRSPENITGQVKAHLKWINQNETAAIALAKKAQAIFTEQFLMESSISDIYSGIEDRKEKLNYAYLAKSLNYKVNLIWAPKKFDKQDFRKFIERINRQTYKNITLHLLLDKTEYAIFQKAIDGAIAEIKHEVVVHEARLFERNEKNKILGYLSIGKALSEIYENLNENDLFSVVSDKDELFGEHFASLVRPFEDNNELNVAFSDVLFKRADGEKVIYDKSESVFMPEPTSSKHLANSRYLIRKTTADWVSCTLPYLEVAFSKAFFIKAKYTARVNRASCIVDVRECDYDLSLIRSDIELISDVMTPEEKQVNGRHENQEQMLSVGGTSISWHISQLSRNDKREIIAHLLEALSLPNWISGSIRFLHRILTKDVKNKTE